MDDIVQEDLGLRASEIGVWIQLYSECNDVNHFVIHRPQEGIWVAFQPYPSNHSIYLCYSDNEGAPTQPILASENSQNQSVSQVRVPPIPAKIYVARNGSCQHKSTSCRKRID